MSYSNCLNELLALKEFTIMSSSPESTAKKVNKFLVKMEVLEVDKESLEKKIEGMSADAEKALLAGIGEKDISKVLNILGLHPTTRKGIV